MLKKNNIRGVSNGDNFVILSESEESPSIKNGILHCVKDDCYGA